ncbi:MAG: hypothetical protein EPN92_08110, partial [Chitinophagaceae bacterium]
MKKILISCFTLLVSCFVLAHPGIGIVTDSKGNIYYTDLKYVWKVTPDGKKSAVVSNVHTHELYMDAENNLYGEHLWYNGEKLNTWGHYVWCLKNTGELVKETEPTEGFLDNYSFVRDSAGNMYWVERFTVTRFMKKSPDGKVTKLAEGKFGFIGWIYATANGNIYFTESNKLQKLTPDGKLIVLADNLGSKSTDFSVMGHNYSSYGIWTDAADNIYIAMIDAKKVIRICPDGKAKNISGSNSLWTACSGLFDNDGNLWLLENSMTNEVRVRKISKEKLTGSGEPASQFTGRTHLLITTLTGA